MKTNNYTTAVAQARPQKMSFSKVIATKSYQTMIANTLTDPKKRERFVSAIVSAVAVNKALQECENSTILAGALLGESLGLTPSPQLGQYYLVPFKDNKAGVTNAVFVLGLTF